MASGLGESTSISSQNPSCSSGDSNTNDTGDFECNICLDLAQDPIVTLCGHLFCWPCLYRWLHHHSYSHECPVCKALILEEKVVPLYGRGKNREDPRSKPIPGMEIPNPPSGQRPEAAEPSNSNQYTPPGFGMIGTHFTRGYVPPPTTTTTRFSNMALFNAYDGPFPSLFNIQVHNIPTSPGYAYPFPNVFLGGLQGGFGQPPSSTPRGQEILLKNLLVITGFFVLLAVICY